MDWLEEELKSALSRKEPAGGFDERVLAAARRPKTVMLPRRWMAAAAALVVLAGAGQAYRWHRGQEARDQVMLAMRITGKKLSYVQTRIAGDRQ